MGTGAAGVMDSYLVRPSYFVAGNGGLSASPAQENRLATSLATLCVWERSWEEAKRSLGGKERR